MKLDRFIAFDTETTGVGDDARIVEITLARFDASPEGVLGPVDVWSQLLWPGDIDWTDAGVRRALEVNRLTQEDLFGKPTFLLVFPEICRRFAQADTWVAHNTEFDLRMLRQERQRLEGDTSAKVPRPKAVFDTMLLDLVLNVGYLKRRLECVAPRWGITVDEATAAHQAESDALTCGQIFAAMLPKLPEELAEALRLQDGARATWTSICTRAKARDQRATAKPDI